MRTRVAEVTGAAVGAGVNSGVSVCRGAARTRRTGRMARSRGAARTRRTDRRQVSPRRRLVVVAVGPVGPGQPTRRREFLLGHGAPPGSRYGTQRRDTRIWEQYSGTIDDLRR